MRLARRLLDIEIVKPKLDEMTKEAQAGAERARELRTRLEEATAKVDDLVVEARSTLKRAVEFLEREGLRGKKSGMFERVHDGEAGRSDDRERMRDGKRSRE